MFGRTERITVRIETPTEEITKKFPVEHTERGDYAVIERAIGRKLGWKAHFDNRCIRTERKAFGRIENKIEVMMGSLEASRYDFELKQFETPKWGKKESKEFIEAQVLKQRGRGITEHTPIMIYIVAVLVIVSIVIGIMGLAGIKIGL
jgi:hypothetical protein